MARDALPARGRDLERLGRPPDPVEQDREVRGPERDPLRAAEVLGDRETLPEPLDALVDPAEQREIRAEDAERRAPRRLREPTARATSRASSAIGIESANRPPNIRIPAWWARIRARAADGGRAGRAASASASGRGRRSSVARLPEIPALPLEQARPRARGRPPVDPRDGPAAELDGRPYSPMRTAVSAARTRSSIGSTGGASPVVGERDPTARWSAGIGGGRRDRRSRVSAARAGVDRRGQRAAVVAGGVPVIGQLGSRRGGMAPSACGRPPVGRRASSAAAYRACSRARSPGKQLAVDDLPQQGVAGT